jgi:hypothetical protein
MSLEKTAQLLRATQIRTTGPGGATPPVAEALFAANYLNYFGYFKKDAVASELTPREVGSAVSSFQDNFNVQKTGVLTAATIKAMEWPRCGHPDQVRARHQEELRLRQFVAQSIPKWQKGKLTYFIEAYVPGIPRHDQAELLQDAFASWTIHANIDAVRVAKKTKADIVVSTGEGKRSNFDGPGGTLAWATLPDGNDTQLLMLFDLGETWVRDTNKRGILYQPVVAHEIGHLFGLVHSNVQASLMAPFYNPAVSAPRFHDDVERLQNLYGPRTLAEEIRVTPLGGTCAINITGPACTAVYLNGVPMQC